MLANATDYVFTSGAVRSIIGGGTSADEVTMTREQWLWANECARTLAFQDTFTLAPFRASYSGSATPNAPLGMAPVRSMLEGWKATADTILTRSRVNGIDGRGIWASSLASESSTAESAPSLTDAQLASHLTYTSRPAATLRESVSPRRDSFASLFGAVSSSVNAYCRSRSWLPSSYSGHLHGGSPTANAGDFGRFFSTSPEWECNGTASDAPETDSRVSIRPFMFDATFGRRAATTYFREVTDAHDLVFVAETSMTYATPTQPWTAASSLYPVYFFSPIFALCVVPLWKDNRDTYDYDAKRWWAIIPAPDAYGGACRGGDRLTVNIGGSVKTLCDATISAAAAGFNPATIAGTQPRTPGSGSGWTKVGYQLYAYPTAIVAVAQSAGRDLGN